MRGSRCLEVWKLGTVNYLDALTLQERLVSARKACKVPDTLLSLQHPPTFTVGKRRTDHNLLVPESDLIKIGAELHYTQRGGDITFHGPHQAILYPILSLRDIGFGARNYVEKLELTMIEVASLYGVKACAGKTGETGVWVGERKIGAIGVRISYGITSHGLAFNIDPDLNYFKHIVPCGIANKEVTSLGRETGKKLPFKKRKESYPWETDIATKGEEDTMVDLKIDTPKLRVQEDACKEDGSKTMNINCVINFQCISPPSISDSPQRHGKQEEMSSEVMVIEPMEKMRRERKKENSESDDCNKWLAGSQKPKRGRPKKATNLSDNGNDGCGEMQRPKRGRPKKAHCDLIIWNEDMPKPKRGRPKNISQPARQFM
ncbi:AT_hook domain-containing protein/BPL_LplA_LipB domain-containing protein [Cephalotus follicularis]|uniref:lipoyl(octanoyl) transferase n=1 Tax=Cephalotus follicularis TaxID=3775 RepID=A0A1Q3BT38_CEPFO|nr:AT_hook domain-containing protein/BPL_LplA_LipB domain-containing protein [Cephalotus follicularis]